MKRYLLLAAVAATLIGGCAKESERATATGEGTVRAINAIATSPNFTFLIEERSLGQVEFKTPTAGNSWDDLEYTFNFEAPLESDFTRTRVASIFLDVEKDRDYTLLLSGAVDSPDITVWESGIREWQGSETASEVRFANASPALGPVDVYFDPTGTAPADGNRLGTVDFGEILPAQEFPSGERTLILTAVDDPATVLFESTPLTLAERNAYIISPFDADAGDVSPVPVVLINSTVGGGGPIVDVNARPTARFFHASRDMGNADIYTDDPLTTPIVSNQAFGEYTSDIPVEPGATQITYTTAGNTGSILIDAERPFSNEARHSVFAVRDTDGQDTLGNFIIDRRSVETRTRLTLVNASSDNPIVDLYLTLDGDTPDDTFPLLAGMTLLEPPATLSLLPDQYDLYLTVVSEKTVLVGPVPLDAGAGDVIEGLIYDTVDPNVPRLEFIPLP